MSDGENPNCSSDSVNESEGILLDDYIKAQTDREEEAQAVLGASDANNCTYDQVSICRLTTQDTGGHWLQNTFPQLSFSCSFFASCCT